MCVASVSWEPGIEWVLENLSDLNQHVNNLGEGSLCLALIGTSSEGNNWLVFGWVLK